MLLSKVFSVFRYQNVLITLSGLGFFLFIRCNFSHCDLTNLNTFPRSQINVQTITPNLKSMMHYAISCMVYKVKQILKSSLIM